MNTSEDQKKLLILFALVFAIIFAWQYFMDTTPPPVAQQTTVETEAQQAGVMQPSALAEIKATTLIKPRQAVLEQSPRLSINTAALQGSINLQGALIDDLTLLRYNETTDPNSSHIVLFAPAQTEHPYGAQFGWVSADKGMSVPDGQTVWTASDKTLSDNNQAVTLSWDNGAGVKFVQEFNVDDNYVFSVTQRVVNTSNQPIKLLPFGRIVRTGTPVTGGYMVLHEGPIGFINDGLEELSYDDVAKKKEVRYKKAQGGWIGFTDKYWLSAFIPDQKQDFEFFFQDHVTGTTSNFMAGYYGQMVEIAPGASMESTNHLFSGAKILDLLDHYEEKLGVKHFDKAVDFGWFYLITKPLFYILDAIYHWIGNFGIAILLLTVMIKLLFFPLANKSYRSMAKMKNLQPKMEKLKERYKGDKMKLNQELMGLYKKEKVNPMAGCLPMIIQIPVFFALYKVLFVSIEMRQAPFFGWIQDLSAPDPTTVFNLFGVIPWDPPSFLMLGAWPLIMGITMLIQQKLNPAPADPIQARMFLLMPIMFTYMLAQFPAGLVIYWAWSNVLSIIQQWVMMRTVTQQQAAK